MNAGELKFFLRNVRDDAEVLIGEARHPLCSVGYPDAARKLDAEGKYGSVHLMGEASRGLKAATTLEEVLVSAFKKAPVLATVVCPVCGEPATTGFLTTNIYCLKDQSHWGRRAPDPPGTKCDHCPNPLGCEPANVCTRHWWGR
jgi:hypothetical protein